MFRILRAVFRLGQAMAPRVGEVQCIQVAAGDTLVFHVPQAACDQEPFRSHAREVLERALKETGVRVLVLPEALKLTSVLKFPNSNKNTDDA